MTDTIRFRNMLSPLGVLATVAVLIAGCGDDGTTRPDEDDVDILYQETFNSVPDGSIPVGWTTWEQQAATEEGPHEWRVKNGKLRQSSNIQAPVTPGLSWALDYEGTMAIVGDTSWVNISLKVDITPQDDDGVGVIFRWMPSDVDPDGNFYRLLMVDDPSSNGPKLRLDRRTDGEWVILEELTTSYSGYDKGRKITVQVDMVVDEIVVYLNSTEVFRLTDAVADGGLSKGKVGLFCYAEEGVDFDNVEVRRRGP